MMSMATRPLLFGNIYFPTFERINHGKDHRTSTSSDQKLASIFWTPSDKWYSVTCNAQESRYRKIGFSTLQKHLETLAQTKQANGFILKPESETNWLYTYYKDKGAQKKGQPLSILGIPVFITDEEQSADLSTLTGIMDLTEKQASQRKLQNYVSTVLKNHFYLDKKALGIQKSSPNPKLIFEPARAEEMRTLIDAQNAIAKMLQTPQSI